MKPIPLSDFGRDHWNLLAYVESRCVDDKGLPDLRHMRSNPVSHPGLSPRGQGFGGWKPEYATRLKGHTKESPVLRRGHDDWDCADDLAHAGLIEIEGTGINPVWSMTKLGSSVAAALRQHKAGGGLYSTFAP